MSTKDRRPLIDGITNEPEVDPKAARDFVYQNKPKSEETAPAAEGGIPGPIEPPAA